MSVYRTIGPTLVYYSHINLNNMKTLLMELVIM